MAHFTRDTILNIEFIKINMFGVEGEEEKYAFEWGTDRMQTRGISLLNSSEYFAGSHS